jgi:hypothetical protein
MLTWIMDIKLRKFNSKELCLRAITEQLWFCSSAGVMMMMSAIPVKTNGNRIDDVAKSNQKTHQVVFSFFSLPHRVKKRLKIHNAIADKIVKIFGKEYFPSSIISFCISC